MCSLLSGTGRGIVAGFSTGIPDLRTRQRRVSRLLTVKHEQEYGHTQACQQMNERHQHGVRSNRTGRKRRDVTDETQRQNDGQQYHADQGEQRRTLEAHGGSIAPFMRQTLIRLRAAEAWSHRGQGPWFGPAWPSTWIGHEASLDSAYLQPDGGHTVTPSTD